MNRSLSRRRLLHNALAAGALGAFGASGVRGEDDLAPTFAPPDAFPSQDPGRVYDTVLWAHTEIDKVARVVEASPALANAAIDWGFGDWESALGAASHMGRPDMAELLLRHGARPDLFAHAMLGHVDVVRAIVSGMPGIQSTFGPHGITLLAHAKAGKERAAAVVEYLEEVGGADPRQESQPLPIPIEGYVGTYAWGVSEADTVKVAARGELLGLTHGDGFPRRLWHQGDHVFAPFGNGTLTVRFEVRGDEAVSLSVWDPDRVMSGRRVYGGRVAETPGD